MKKLQLTGQRFGRLVVIGEATPSDPTPGGTQSRMRWLCRCDCGVERVVLRASLTSGNTKSCGCYRVEEGIKKGKATKKHGGYVGNYPSPEWYTWSSMKSRCTNPKNPGYKHYGGRGITICERWASFENFLADMGKRPSDELSLDRIDVNGPYAPDNCRWATVKQQTRNTRRSVFVEFRGETKTVAEWCEIVGLCRNEYEARTKKGRMAPQEALSLPPTYVDGRGGPIGRKPRLFTLRGETRTLRAWAEIAGANYGTVANKIGAGMAPEQALFGKKP